MTDTANALADTTVDPVAGGNAPSTDPGNNSVPTNTSSATDPSVENVDSEAEQRVVQREDETTTRKRYELRETGFREVPKRWRKFYRHWQGPEDDLASNEVLCPVCKVVIRSYRDYKPGDRVYCMPCMSRLIIVERPDGDYEADVIYT